MPKKIMVASVHPAFGELLRLSLEKSGRYVVRLAASCADARDEMGNTPYAMALLDADLNDASARSALVEIALWFPAVPLILFPPQNNPHHPLMNGLPYKAWIRKPFYLPELLEAADAVSAGGTWAPGALAEPTTPTNPAWLKEDLAPGSPLSNLLHQDCLGAVFLTLNGPIVAQAGDLPPSAAEEIVALINKSWHDEQTSDLVRYTRLEAANADIMLYVTMLEKPILGALVFSPTTPLMRARSIAVEAVRSLHHHAKAAENEPPSADKEIQKPAEQAAVWQAEMAAEGEPVDGLLLELLASAPSPDPVRAKPKPKPKKNPDWLLDENIVPMEEQEFKFPWDVEPAKPIDPWEISSAGVNKTAQAADTKPITASSEMTAPGIRAPAETNQIFTCILIPRQAGLPLEGDLARMIEQNLPLLCIRNDWNIRNLQISPQALQFTVEVAPSISAGYLVRVLRQQTSQQINETFPQYSATQGVGDFWAPGFLIVSGGRPPAPHLLQDFIQQTRRRQGLSKS